MANYPYPRGNLPGHPIREFCSRVSENYDSDENLLIAFSNALQVLTNYTGSQKCLSFKSKSSVDGRPWGFQRCTELVFPNCSNGTSDGEMFLKYDWNFQEFTESCQKKYHINPQERILIDTYGSSFEYGSNIIFSNGMLDPWSGYGILSLFNKKHEIVIIPDAAHQLDLRADHLADPQSVRNARNLYISKFKEWIEEFKELTWARSPIFFQ